MRRTALAAGCALTTFALAGCSSSSSSSPAPSKPGATSTSAAPAADTVVIQNFTFQPASLTVAPGATVTVTNKDSVTHTLTSTSNPKAFDTGDIPAGSSKTFTAPAKAGTYAYLCRIHTFMHGTLVVD